MKICGRKALKLSKIPQLDNFDTETITLDELITVLKNMKNNKAPG
jgi:hypothetical protein